MLVLKGQDLLLDLLEALYDEFTENFFIREVLPETTAMHTTDHTPLTLKPVSIVCNHTSFVAQEYYSTSGVLVFKPSWT